MQVLLQLLLEHMLPINDSVVDYWLIYHVAG